MIGKFEHPSSKSLYTLEKVIFETNDISILQAKTAIGTPVVIKKLASNASEFALNQLANEIRLYPSLTHPNITIMFESCAIEHWLVLESMQNDLFNLLIDKPSLPLNTTVSILEQIASAVKYLQSLSIIHCDIKPENILFNEIPSAASEPCYRVKLADFGSALQLPSDAEDNTLQSTGGTYYYIAPEVFVTQRASFASDIYSFGLLAYVLLTKFQPYYQFSKDQILGFILPALYNNIDLSLLPPEDTQWFQAEYKFDTCLWSHLLQHNLRNPIEIIPENYRSLITNCWQVEPKSRFTIDQVIATIHEVQAIGEETKLTSTRSEQAISSLNSVLETTSHSGWVPPPAIKIQPSKSSSKNKSSRPSHEHSTGPVKKRNHIARDETEITTETSSTKLSSSRFTLMPPPKQQKMDDTIIGLNHSL